MNTIAVSFNRYNFHSYFKNFLEVRNVRKSNFIQVDTQANSYSQFTFDLELKSSTMIKSVYLKNYRYIRNWFYKDLNSGLSSTNTNEILDQGKYLISFIIEGKRRFKYKDIVIVVLECDGKEIKSKIPFPQPTNSLTYN